MLLKAACLAGHRRSGAAGQARERRVDSQQLPAPAEPVRPPAPKRRARFRLSLVSYLALAFLAVLVVLLFGLRWAQQATREATALVASVESRCGPILRIARELNDAATAFDRDIGVMARPQSPDDESKLRASAAKLLGALYDFERLEATTPDLPRSVLEERVVAFRTDGLALGELYRQRAAAVRRSLSAADALADRSARAAGGFESGDQVVARRSLAELARAAASLRESVAASLVTAPAGTDANAVRDGSVLRAMMRSQSAELARSPGHAWVELQREDLGATLQALQDVRALDQRIDASRTAFAGMARELRSLVEADLQDPAVQMLSEAAGRARSTARVAEAQFLRVAEAVLGVVLVIAVVIIYGIASPARRLLHATRHLSGGALDVRVPRGGVRELDELAASFNEMADALDTTQTALQRQRAALEDRVAQRTAQLRYLANHDALTGLPNRRELGARLTQAGERARAAGRPCAVLYMDIDNFKTINDSLGHEFGDRFLRAIAARLSRLAGEATFIARLGGDEFMLVAEGLDSTEAAEGKAGRILQEFQRPLNIDGRELLTSLSIGVAVFPDHGETADALVRAADSALFRAKERGRNGYVVYRADMLAAASRRFHMEQGLRRALETGDFLLHFQPEVSLTEMRTTVVEALLRWRLPDGRIVPASEFMPVAEQSGLILELSDWVLQRALAAAGELRRSAWPQARVAVNVSAEQFLTGCFVESVERALREAQMPPDCLEVELTETALQTGPMAVEALRELRSMGVTIALDDFGAGYSSLKSIDELPLTRVKIDRSLMKDVDQNGSATAIADSIIRLCRTLGLTVTAEGIEKPGQLDFLATCGAVHAQGYLIARPSTLDDVAAFVRDTPARVSAKWPNAGLLGAAARSDGGSSVTILRPRGR